MRAKLFPFQETALADLHEKINEAHSLWSEKNPQVITFSAPTGAGKTIIMTALFEEIIFGHAFGIADMNSVFVWLSDMPELNEQTRLKIESKSEKFRVRDIRIVDSSFDAEYFAKGSINFLNTQKLGSDKLLTQKGDKRQYTIWETLANTAARQPKSFYVVIDEAHRGTFTSAQEKNKAQSIMQKFIKGSREDGLPIMPLIIGVTATPQRFQQLIAGTISTEHKVVVRPEDVRESGLLKDRIIIHFPEIEINADMTMFKEAVINWKRKCDCWAAYCEREEIKNAVKPAFIVQVENGNEREITISDLGTCIDIIEESLGRKLRAGEAVHTFDGRETVKVRNYEIFSIDASRIEESNSAKIVFFKMNLSTGWDCPRAETMMSFRPANDYTYIAQLLGRMIRTPLARRIESEAELNDVSLYLPFFNTETVKKVEKALRESEESLPIETGTHKELITLKRNPKFDGIFNSMNLVTYRVDSMTRHPALRRLIALVRALTMDMIEPEIWGDTRQSVLQKFDEEIAVLKETDKFDEISRAMTAFALRTLTIDYGNDTTNPTEESIELVSLSEIDLTNLFERAGKILGEGLHMEYWKRHGDRDAEEVKCEVIVLVGDNEAMERIEAFAEEHFCKIYDTFHTSFRKLREERRDYYKKLALSSATSIALDWEPPQTIDFSVGADAEVYDRHLYIPSDDSDFRISLNSWESGLIKEELANSDVVAWLRNLDRKKWSLEIPYEVNGVTTSMFPDLIIIRADVSGEYVFDILEPHDPSRKDNYPKAVGLAKFAEKHGELFGRIQLIRREHKHGRNIFYRLDMRKLDIMNNIRGITSNDELDRIFSDKAVVFS
jgi:type III restriction enzyme